jgi:hypothetical protein
VRRPVAGDARRQRALPRERAQDLVAGDDQRRTVSIALAVEPRAGERRVGPDVRPLERVVEPQHDRRGLAGRRQRDLVAVLEGGAAHPGAVQEHPVATLGGDVEAPVAADDLRVAAGDPQVPETEVAARVAPDPEGVVDDRYPRGGFPEQGQLHR